MVLAEVEEVRLRRAVESRVVARNPDILAAPDKLAFAQQHVEVVRKRRASVAVLIEVLMLACHSAVRTKPRGLVVAVDPVVASPRAVVARIVVE